MHLVLCTKFQLDPSMHSHFIAIFFKSAKRRRIRKNLNETLGTLSRKRPEQFVLNWVCRLTYLAGIAAANLVEFEQEILELHRCENPVLFLPVNILTVWLALASWAARHTTVYLDLIKY